MFIRHLSILSGYFLSMLFVSSESLAAEIIWNGFASMYARDSITDDVRDASTDDKGWGFNDTKFGLNLRSDITEEWAAVAQIVVSQKSYMPTNETPSWGGEFDWFFLSYRNMEYGFEVKVGRQLFPSTLTSQYVDVGLTYPWRKLPQQFSGIAQFKSFEGISVSREVQISDVNFDFQIFGGDGKTQLQPGAASKLDVNNMFGARVSAEGDGWKLQSVSAQLDLTYSAAMYLQVAPGVTYVERILPKLGIWLLGGKYDRGGLVAYAEYGHSSVEDDNVAEVTTYYGTLGYHIGKFLPHYTYSRGDWLVAPFRDGIETSHTIGLNYQIDPSILLKAEYLRQFDKDGIVFLTQANAWAESFAVGINVVF